MILIRLEDVMRVTFGYLSVGLHWRNSTRYDDSIKNFNKLISSNSENAKEICPNDFKVSMIWILHGVLGRIKRNILTTEKNLQLIDFTEQRRAQASDQTDWEQKYNGFLFW